MDNNLPEILDVTPEADEAIEAALDPEIRPPTNAKLIGTYHGKPMHAWMELVNIQSASVAKAKKTTNAVFTVGVKIRGEGSPNSNAGKMIFCRYVIDFNALNGLSNDEGMTRFSHQNMRALKSLMHATNYAPVNAGTGIQKELLKTLFPVGGVPPSPLLGKTVRAKVWRKGAKEDKQYPKDWEYGVEVFLPYETVGNTSFSE